MPELKSNTYLVVGSDAESEAILALNRAGGVIIDLRKQRGEATEIWAWIPDESISSFSAWYENFKERHSAFKPRTSKRRILCCGLLMSVVAFIIFDWITVGNDSNLNWPPWADAQLRLPFLTLTSVISGAVALAFARSQLELRRSRLLILTGGAIMWVTCAYTFWRCYQFQTSSGGTGPFWIVTGIMFLLPIAVAHTTVRLWNHFIQT